MTDPLPLVRLQLQRTLEKIAWIEQARSKTLPDDHFMTADLTVQTVRYLSDAVATLEAEQHINRTLTRTILDVQAERDRLRRALAFYADAENYVIKPQIDYAVDPSKFPPFQWDATDVDVDGGERARASIAASTGETP